MSQQLDVSTRRILTFPAIRPVEYVTFPSLVTSLIHLGHAICTYNSKSFVTNKNNARNSIRLVDDVVLFLEELRNDQSGFHSSFILSLSELHFAFQKIQFLLEDCSRENSKLLMLVKAEEVSGMFREFIRDIGVALDVLPLEEMDVSVEVVELVEFVRTQCLKCSFLLDLDDKKAARKVFSILNQFEGGFVPEPNDFRLVLEYLAIQSWSECNREVKFLEGEIGRELLSDKTKEVGFLSSLMGFLIYCRCTMFDVVDSVGTLHLGIGCRSEIFRFLNPDDFRCPISLELMTDPVTLSTGHTYDRSSILKWFAAGNHTCPKTSESLVCIDLVPNVSLKKLIKQYCLQNGIAFSEPGGSEGEKVSRKVDVHCVAAQQAMRFICDYLVGRLLVERSEMQNKIVYEMRLLTKTSVFNRSRLVESGAISLLMILLSSMESTTQENAMATLLNLSKFPVSKKEIVESGGLILILDVLQEGLQMKARQYAAGTLFYLAWVEEYRIMIGEIPEIFPALMELIREGTDQSKKSALVTIFGLLTHPGNHRRALETGLVPFLVTLLRSLRKEDLITDSLAVFVTLAERRGGAMAILRAGAIPTIVDVFSATNSKVAKEHCVSLLLSLCSIGGADAVHILVKNPSVMGPLYSLLTRGTPQASKKASALIRMIHEFNEKSSSGLFTPAIQREQFVQAC